MTSREKEASSPPNDCFICADPDPAGPPSLGVRFEELAPHGVRSRFTLPSCYQSFDGVGHGGVLSAILAEAFVRVCAATEPRPIDVAQLKIELRKAVAIGQPHVLEAQASLQPDGSYAAVGTICTEGGIVCVEGRAVCRVVAPPLDQDASP